MTTDNAPTADDIRSSVEPKSDQLNADDLIGGTLTVTITGVRKGDREQPIVVECEGTRPYKPCKTMRRVLLALYGDDPKAWVGNRLTLYRDDGVTWAGVKVGGIRISHATGIKEPRTFLLTFARGKRAEVVLQPLSDDAGYVADVRREIAAATSVGALAEIGAILKGKSKAIQQAVRADYATRQRELIANDMADSEQEAGL